MTRIPLLIAIMLVTLLIVFPSMVAALFSGGPASLSLLGVGLIVLAHQLRRRFNKVASHHTIGH